METYRLKSKVVESDREFLIQTTNDTNRSAISSEVYVDGNLTESVTHPHPAEINPEEVLSLLKLAHGEKIKEIETLLEAYRKILSKGEPESLLQLGTAFFYRRFYQEAQVLFSKVLSLDTENHQAYFYLGKTELAIGHIDESVTAFGNAVTIRPGFADYRCGHGEALLARGDYSGAVKEFEEAINLNLYYGDAYFDLGLALLVSIPSVQEPAPVISRANDSFKKASLINTDYDRITFEQAFQAMHDGDYNLAQRLFLQVRETKREKHRRDFAGFYMKFVLQPEWVTEEALEERIKYLEAQIERNPTYVDLYADLSRCYLERARMYWKKGTDQYRKTIELSPTLASAVYCLDEAEREYKNICATLEKMVKKG